MSTQKEMNLKEFKETYMGKQSKWDFNKFRITCKNCESDKVEFNGYLESVGGYYGEHTLTGKIVVKCHSCGTAFSIDVSDNEELNYEGEKQYSEDN